MEEKSICSGIVFVHGGRIVRRWFVKNKNFEIQDFQKIPNIEKSRFHAFLQNSSYRKFLIGMRPFLGRLMCRLEENFWDEEIIEKINWITLEIHVQLKKKFQ